MSYTPRTDKVTWHFNDSKAAVVSADFARGLERELALNAQMLAQQCDHAREAETQLSEVLGKDRRKTREYNILVQENRALLADKKRLDFLDSQIWPDQPRPDYTPPIVQLVVKRNHDPQGEWVNVAQSGRSAIDDAMRAAQPAANPPK